MQAAVGGFANGNAAHSEVVPDHSDRIKISIGRETKPLITRPKERSARTDRKRYGNLLPGPAAIDGDGGDDVLQKALNPDLNDIFRIARVRHHEWFKGVVQRPGSG